MCRSGSGGGGCGGGGVYCVHACVCMRACGIVHSWYDVDVVRAYVVTLRLWHVCACEVRVQVCVRDVSVGVRVDVRWRRRLRC